MGAPGTAHRWHRMTKIEKRKNRKSYNVENGKTKSKDRSFEVRDFGALALTRSKYGTHRGLQCCLFGMSRAGREPAGSKLRKAAGSKRGKHRSALMVARTPDFTPGTSRRTFLMAAASSAAVPIANTLSSEPARAQGSRNAGEPNVIPVEIVFDGAIYKVFDVVTIAGLWPQWHVLTRAVAGVTERPFQKGDRIYEFIRSPQGPGELDWQIVQLDRPRGARMEAQDGTSITYTFEEGEDGTFFRRVLELGSTFGAQTPPPATNRTEQASVANLKRLVENILWREQKGRYLR
jgi:hypothetical protein